jgi:hypothetical protein
MTGIQNFPSSSLSSCRHRERRPATPGGCRLHDGVIGQVPGEVDHITQQFEILRDNRRAFLVNQLKIVMFRQLVPS